MKFRKDIYSGLGLEVYFFRTDLFYLHIDDVSFRFVSNDCSGTLYSTNDAFSFFRDDGGNYYITDYDNKVDFPVFGSISGSCGSCTIQSNSPDFGYPIVNYILDPNITTADHFYIDFDQ